MVINNNKLQKEIMHLNNIISKKYLGEECNIPEYEFNFSDIWIKNDIAYILLKSENIDETFNDICQVVEESPMCNDIKDAIPMQEAYRDAEIRRDFATAFKNVEKGEELSYALGYGLSNSDLTNLAKLHKANSFREKIESLLTDCNFHYECDLMFSGDYSMWLRKEKT